MPPAPSGDRISYAPSLAPSGSVREPLSFPVSKITRPVQDDVHLARGQLRASPHEHEPLSVAADVVVSQRHRADVELTLEERPRRPRLEDRLRPDLDGTDLPALQVDDLVA